MLDAPDKPRPPDPCSLVIFGVTGDLTHRLITPALYNLAESNLLPSDFCIVGIVRKPMSAAVLRKSLIDGLHKYSKRKIDESIAARVFSCLTTLQADPDDPASFDRLSDELANAERERRTHGNRLFYLATPPNAFAPIARQLGRTGLLKEEHGRWRRLVVEKPFGTDLASARRLDDELHKLMDEHQIYRIDHYLGKETVQNIMVLRFSNGMFEPIWNRHHIDHVQITVDEQLGVGHRGAFYDSTGALRDMVPNHLFQLMSLVAMEPPAKFDAHTVRSKKAELLSAIQTPSRDEALRNSVRGQYEAGDINGSRIPAYRATPDVRPDSVTETYAALKLTVDNWRWAGVPFYLRTGKRLTKRSTEIAIRFKRAPYALFRETPVDELDADWLILKIQPEEGIRLRFNAKRPGPAMALESVAMNFQYKDYFKQAPAVGYETLIYDCLIGDATLFQRADQVEAAWALVEPVLEGWANTTPRHFPNYAAGSEGPSAANDLLARDGRSWRRIN